MPPKSDVRIRIDSHRLMRADSVSEAPTSVMLIRQQEAERSREARKRFVRRAWVHGIAFVLSYLLTAGSALLGILLWVQPDDLLALVLVFILGSAVFVGAFAGIRLLVLHRIFEEYPNKEEDPGIHHHVGKSIAYAFLALVLAIVLTGFLVHLASAFS
jgi:hypothetical protein